MQTQAIRPLFTLILARHGREEIHMLKLTAFVLGLTMLIGSTALAEETLNQVISRTDMTNADSVYELAKWCAEHQMPTKANQYYNQVLKIDRDHQATREALRQVKVGNNWISEKMLNAANKSPATAEAAPVARAATGVGPSASEVKWDLTPPTDPAPQNPFISSYIGSLPALANDSREMDQAINTLLLKDNLPMAIPRLCEAMLRPDFNDIYGAAMLSMALIKTDKLAVAKPLLGFMAKCSEHVADADDLCTFARISAMFNDRRVVPRLIELMDHPDESVRFDATGAVAEITRLPERNLSKEKATAWWNLNHNISDEQIYGEQLTSNDPHVAVKAAAALYERRDKRIVPVLIKLLRNDDPRVGDQAIAILQKITGSDWSYDSRAPADVKKQRVDVLEKWWKDEKDTYVWIESGDKSAPGKAADPMQRLVDQLGSVSGNDASDAESQLAGKSEGAVPALIAGLERQSILIRRKCQELLTRITKQTIAFDAGGTEEERAKGVAAWKKWAIAQELIKDEASEDADDDSDQ